MTDEINGSKNGSDVAIGASAVREAEPKDTIPSKPATEADLNKVEKRMSVFERSTLRWTRASFVIVLATAVFICLQWLEMRSGGKDTHDLATAADTQAKKMADMSSAADKISQAAEGMATQEQKIAKASQDSVLAVQRQMRQDQRPWIKTDLGEPGADGKVRWWNRVGDPLNVPIRFTNTGKTPAKHVTAVIYVDILPKDQVPKLPIYGARKKLPTGATRSFLAGWKITTGRIFPGNHADDTVTKVEVVNGEMRRAILGVPQANDFAHGNSYLLMHGKIDYWDEFGTHHWSIFCSANFVDGGSANITKCANYADDDGN